MKPAAILLLTAFAISMSMAGTVRGGTPAVAGTDAEVTYESRGVLQSLDPKSRQATIAHEAIPGYMDAMIMSFDVPDFGQTKDLQPGDVLAFRLCVAGTRAWIEHISKTGGKAAPLITAAPADAARELGAGDLMPDAELVDQSGKKFHFVDFRGNALVVTFIYTGCPLPTYCPLVNRNFGAAQSLLARLGQGDNWRLLSISMDPVHDTPAVLAGFAKYQGADGNHWMFATASEKVVRQLGGSVGLEFKTTNGTIFHNLRTVVVGPDGRIRRIFAGNTWTPQEVVAEVRAAMKQSR